MIEIDSNKMVTLLSTLTISMLLSVEDQLPAHSLVNRRIKKVEEAVRDLAKCKAGPLDEQLVDVGVAAWNSAIRQMQVGLMAGKPRVTRDARGRFMRMEA